MQKLSKTQNILEDKRFINSESYFSNHVIIMSKAMKGLPGLPEYPILSKEHLHEEPSFVLFNPMEIRTIKMFSMMKYFKKVSNRVEDAGTKFYKLFKVSKVIKGDFKFKMIALTVWKNVDEFHDLHNSESFNEVVPLRNKAIKLFAEAKGIIE